MRTHPSIKLIIKELNVNYTHGRIKQIEIIVYKISYFFQEDSKMAARGRKQKASL
jgi:hypothetical protein